MSEFERITLFHSAYDKMEEGFGIHGVEIIMILKGDLGAVQFVLYTGWLLPSTVGVKPEEDTISYNIHRYHDGLAIRNDGLSMYPMPVDLGYHSPKPMYEDHTPMSDDCEYVPKGEKCYYDGSGLNAALPFYALLQGGSDGVWEHLERWYRTWFEDAELVVFPVMTATDRP